MRHQDPHDEAKTLKGLSFWKITLQWQWGFVVRLIIPIIMFKTPLACLILMGFKHHASYVVGLILEENE
jgi:hypothetical protein